MLPKSISSLYVIFVLFWKPFAQGTYRVDSSGAKADAFQTDGDLPPEALWKTYGRASAGLVNGWFSRKKTDPLVLLTQEQRLDFSVAKALAEFVSISYCYDLEAIANWTCSRCSQRPGFIVTEVVENKAWNVSCYLGYYPPWNAKLVIFRGTHGNDFGNWIENLKATQHQVRLNLTLPGIDELRVHNGFSRIWNIPFKDSVLTAVMHLVNIYGKEGPLYVAGHSAGGATAQLAAFSFKTLLGFDDVRLYTFGAPRVGNWAFAAMMTSLMSESWRFTHNRDIVPILPWMVMGFWHSAQEVFQQDQDISLGQTITTYRVCDGTGEDPKGHNSMCPFGFGCSSVYDHYFYLNTIMENDGTC